MDTMRLMGQADAALREITGCRFPARTGSVLREGEDLAILTTERALTEVLLAARDLEREGIHAKVVALYADRGVDPEILREAGRTGMVFVLDGPEGRRAVGEAFPEGIPFPVRSIHLEAGDPGQGLAATYRTGAEAVYRQVVDAA